MARKTTFESVFGALLAAPQALRRGRDLCVTVRDRALDVAEGAERFESGLREAQHGALAMLGQKPEAPLRLEVIESRPNPPPAKTKRVKK